MDKKKKIMNWFSLLLGHNRPLTNLENKNSIDIDNENVIAIRCRADDVFRKQSLEDVVNNDDYLEIDCMDFCPNSAIKQLYIKNTCIIELYELFLEDPKTTAAPNMNGCMIIGRWIYDKTNDKYCVSMETIVRPGSDASCSEYEMDFGGMIKLNLRNKLHSLRNETNLQYDLTCWVHSNLGLGVFFSGADCQLHNQLKNKTHPKFLTAIVIDTLTPKKELGVFTFKNGNNDDVSINSRSELTKLYSLEEWFQWAIEKQKLSTSFNEIL